MNPSTALVLVKLVHTLAWAFFAGCIVALPVAAYRGCEHNCAGHRISDVIMRVRDLSPSHIVDAVFEEVRQFSGDRQRDDVTLIVARCKSR